MIIFKEVSLNDIYSSLFESEIAPIKTLILFISMSLISIMLDELNFFSHIAEIILKHCSKSQIKLFVVLFICISVLTMFTSNDIVILTFTPFICYFCHHAKINPIPYLILEFVAANTFSMIFIIGNPTNILLASANKIDFFTYFKEMVLPTIGAAGTAFLILFLLFKHNLRDDITSNNNFDDITEITNKPLTIIALSHLIICIILLSISNYINMEMYLITLFIAISLLLFAIIFFIINHDKALFKTIKRLPYGIIPFLISMFVMLKGLENADFTTKIYNLLACKYDVFSYGFSSFFVCSLMNNIPMSVLFSHIATTNSQIYSVIIGSNIGAYLSPIGALAGVMWLNILRNHNIQFSYCKFIRLGIVISIPTIIVALSILLIIL